MKPRKMTDKRLAEITELANSTVSICDDREIYYAFKDLLSEIARLKYIQCYCFSCEGHRKKFERRLGQQMSQK